MNIPATHGMIYTVKYYSVIHIYYKTNCKKSFLWTGIVRGGKKTGRELSGVVKVIWEGNCPGFYLGIHK